MTIRNVESSPQGLRLVFRIFLALLAMVLAERAAEFSHGEPGVSSGEELSSDEDHLQPNYTTPSSDDEATPARQRLREGTILTDVVGRFKVAGDRTSFTITETGQTFGGLENLNLARVLNTIRDEPEADWTISGLVTEHRGLNFLLIQKAIRKTSNQEARGKKPESQARPVAPKKPEAESSGETAAY